MSTGIAGYENRTGAKWSFLGWRPGIEEQRRRWRHHAERRRKEEKVGQRTEKEGKRE